ncbi:MAG TPA: dienelactone hydrolase family protein [Candidatus Sulfotelmatobacter sp.]|nr:dienelactone hydrolase family protein [Candidatus Sulfotelmatobacter sp.]
MGKNVSVSVNGYDLPCYLAEPESKPKGGLIVIEEIWGLTDHIRSIADRYAAEGYIVLSPNLLAETKVEKLLTPQDAQDLFNPEKRNAVQPKLREITAPIYSPEFAERAKANLLAAYDYLNKMSGATDRIGVTGFCFGGTYSFQLALIQPKLKCALPFYGHADFSVEQLRQIKCPILAFYGEKDEGLITSLPELKKNMSEAGVNFEAVVYPDCGHAFFNDTNPYAYNETAAKDAWTKSLAFIASHI